MNVFFVELNECMESLDTYKDVQIKCELEALKTIRPLIGDDSKLPFDFKNACRDAADLWGTEEVKEYWEKNRKSKMLEEFEKAFKRIAQYFGGDMIDPRVVRKYFCKL